MAHKRNLTWDEWVKLKAYHDTPWGLKARTTKKKLPKVLEKQPRLPFPKYGKGSLIPWPMNEARNG